ncbi:unnamed protein product [Parajaminaea phylloscopi]
MSAEPGIPGHAEQHTLPSYSRLADVEATQPGSGLLPHGGGAHSFQFDIVPRSDAASFQAGYQGLQQRGFEAWLRGDVLLKGSVNGSQLDFSQCTIELLATESIQSGMGATTSNQVFHAAKVLWRCPRLPSTSANPPAQDSLPSVMPFEFALPEFLPHCVHLPSIRLEYQLIATLYPREDDIEQGPVSRAVAVHLTRYSPPAPATQLLPAAKAQMFSEAIKTWKRTSPMDLEVRLARTLFRRGEPIRLSVTVAPPPEKLVQRGLRIRSVEAQLVRVITPRRAQSVPHSRQKGKDSSRAGHDARQVFADQHVQADGWQPYQHLLKDSTDSVGTSSAGGAASASASTVHHNLSTSLAEEPTREGRTYRTVLAHSGKSCRFSLRRALFLNLSLVPPFATPALPHPSPDHDAPPAGLSPLTLGASAGGGGCESISQETDLSIVQFFVQVTLRMRGSPGTDSAEAAMQTGPSHDAASGPVTQQSESRDIQMQTEVFILPALAGSIGDRLQVPGQEHQELSHSAEPWEEQEDFDGYEDFRDTQGSPSAPLDAVTPRAQGAQNSALAASGHSQMPVGPSHGAEANAEDGALAEIEGQTRPLSADRPTDDVRGPPPSLQQSLHDLRIYPEGADDTPPPPHSPQGDTGLLDSIVEYGSPPFRRQLSSPPAWAESSESQLVYPLQTEFIAGVGMGQRRRGTENSAPPAFSSHDLEQNPPSTPSDTDVPPPDFEFAEQRIEPDAHIVDVSTLGGAANPRSQDADHEGPPAGVPMQHRSRVEPPPYRTSMPAAAGESQSHSHSQVQGVSSTSTLPPSDFQGAQDEEAAPEAGRSFSRQSSGASSSRNEDGTASASEEKARLAAHYGGHSFPSGAGGSHLGRPATQNRASSSTEVSSHADGEEHPDSGSGLPPAYADSEGAGTVARDVPETTERAASDGTMSRPPLREATIARHGPASSSSDALHNSLPLSLGRESEGATSPASSNRSRFMGTPFLSQPRYSAPPAPTAIPQAADARNSREFLDGRHGHFGSDRAAEEEPPVYEA